MKPVLPEAEVNLKEIKGLVLAEYIKPLLEVPGTKGLIDKVSCKIKELDGAYLDDTIKTMEEEDFNFTIVPYALGEGYKVLNKPDSCLIRDGFITIGGEASSGKISFVGALTIDLLKNNPGTCFLFYTLDDGKFMTGKRILSQLNRENLFLPGVYDRHLHKDPYRDILSRIAVLESLSLKSLERQAEVVKKKTGCRKIIIAIDYFQLISFSGGGKERRQEMNEALKALKEIQKRLQDSGGCILFCLSQMNRDPKSGNFRYRDTSEIENQSDVCLDIELLDNDPDRESDERIIRIKKNKMGRRGMKFNTTISRSYNFEKLSVSHAGGSGKKGQAKRRKEISISDRLKKASS